MANNNKPTVDLPFFELLNPAWLTTGATGCLTSSEGGDDKYIYQVGSGGTNFYRYNTQKDSWQQIENLPFTPSAAITARYTNNRGFHGRVLSATSNTVTIPCLTGKLFDGKALRVLHGPGAGQERTLTFLREITHDFGIATTVTSTGSLMSLADSTKKWRVNQWAGHTLAIKFGTDATQYKKIQYNDATTLYIYDLNLISHDPWNQSAWATVAPYSVPTASSSVYEIISGEYSVADWDVTPDYRSYFTTLTGGIFMMSATVLWYYDVIHGSWQQKSVPTGIFQAAIGTDFSIERTPRNATGVLLANTASGTISGTARTISDSLLNLTSDRYANHRIEISSGTGVGQSRRIVAHTANTFTINKNWDTTPDSTSKFKIYPDYNLLWFVGSAGAATFAYDIDDDFWMQGHNFDDGVVGSIAATMQGWLPIMINTGTYVASGVRAVNSVPTAGGTGYLIGDVLTCSVGGTGAQVRVTNIGASGVVTSIELIHSGTATGFTTGSGKATTGGTGSGCTIEITTVGATSLVTTYTNHFFKAGDSIEITGCTEAAWNTTYNILGVPGVNTFCLSISATAAMLANKAHSTTTTMVDPTKNWIENEHAGRLVHMHAGGSFAPGSQVRWIANNTSNTINIAGTWTAGTNGISKFSIYDAKAFGIHDQRPQANQASYGWATGGSTTTLQDTTKDWVPNQWVGYWMKIEAGTGYAAGSSAGNHPLLGGTQLGRILITASNNNTLTFSTQSFTPDTTTKYEIADTWGICNVAATGVVTDNTKNWVVNQMLGRRVRFTAGTNSPNEHQVSSSTANTMLGMGNPDTTTSYAILGPPPVNAGISLINNWGSANTDIRARYLFTARGGVSTHIHIYDIPSNRWLYGRHFTPTTETFATGSHYAYDGNNTIYMSRTNNSVINRIVGFNIQNLEFTPLATTTWLNGGTVHVGNHMEVVADPTGEYKFLYVMQQTGTLFSRALLF
jgi:hypothetical protein